MYRRRRVSSLELVTRSDRRCFVGELERAAQASIDAASWIHATDGLAVASVLGLAREADQALIAVNERRTGQMFDVATSKDEAVNGTWVYLMVSMMLQAGTIGLTSEGRRKLEIQDEEPQTDGLGDIITLHQG